MTQIIIMSKTFAHLGIECLFLDTVSPIPHQVVQTNWVQRYKSECGLYFKPMHLLCFPIKNKPKTKARLQLNINYAIYTTVDKAKLK